ncbi:MAG: tyrosine-type recombinase/integrase [Candidatus Delongbacteria bacterium]|nr:tyrosine-type recombinase/integrase [Candidatus Delongbacteria bacterium]
MKNINLMIDEYQKYSMISKAEETVRYQESHAKAWIKFLRSINIAYPEQLNNDALMMFIKHSRKKCKFITINKRILYLKQVFNHHRVQNDDLFSLKKFRESRLTYDIIHENELKLILKYDKVIDESKPYELTKKRIILLLLDTGVRQSELLNIEVKNIDFNEQSIYLTRTKTRLARTVFFTHLTRDLLFKYINIDPDRKYLLWNYISYTRYTYRHLEWFMHKIKRDLGINKLNARMFRHTMATALAENGCDVYTIQKILGHTNIKTTEIYLHMSLKKTKSDYEKYNLVDHM